MDYACSKPITVFQKLRITWGRSKSIHLSKDFITFTPIINRKSKHHEPNSAWFELDHELALSFFFSDVQSPPLPGFPHYQIRIHH